MSTRNRKKNGPSRSANGFILEPVLIVFLFTLLFALYAAYSVQSRAALLQASRRSQLDLAVIERGKFIAGEIAWRRRCSMEAYDAERTETILGTAVSFSDCTTYLQAEYKGQNKTFCINLFYDEDGVLKVEYD